MGPIQSSSTREYIIPIDFFPSQFAVYSININKTKDRECNNVDSATGSRPERLFVDQRTVLGFYALNERKGPKVNIYISL